MPKNALWLEYQLESIQFQNGETVRFPASARLLYEPDDHAIFIELPRAERRRIVGDLREHNDAAAPLQELKEIRYSMLVNLPEYKKRLRFYHPMKRGNRIGLSVDKNDNLFFFEDTGRPMFSKDYTLRDVSRGEIDDVTRSTFPPRPKNRNGDRAVWQFHGYRHEH